MVPGPDIAQVCSKTFPNITGEEVILNLISFHSSGIEEIVSPAGSKRRWRVGDGGKQGELMDAVMTLERHGWLKRVKRGERCVWGWGRQTGWRLRWKEEETEQGVGEIRASTNTHTNRCVCVRSDSHECKHTHSMPRGEVVKGHGWLAAAGWFGPQRQSSACWDVWIQMQSSMRHEVGQALHWLCVMSHGKYLFLLLHFKISSVVILLCCLVFQTWLTQYFARFTPWAFIVKEDKGLFFQNQRKMVHVINKGL